MARRGAAGAPGAPGAFADVIVVAAGGSRRMGGIDKLVAVLGGQPLIVRSVAAVRAAPEVDRIVVVVAPGREAEIEAVLVGSADAVVAGGDHRGASVEAGLRALEAMTPLGGEDRVVLVHDAARPLVPASVVGAVARATARHGAAIPVVPVVDTLRRIDGDRVGATVDRTGLAATQTPQGARAGLLRMAFTAFPPASADRVTDEAALLHACTIPVQPVPGDPVNLKVTVPADLVRAEGILAAAAPAASPLRTGLGTDSHPFGPGDPLRLGGVQIDGAPALHGHSDGDVALHALGDALLGAAGLGDLGRMF
ncbi:MAG: 2-C-methyl-D-erythritol 2,4-cyclodiphosphate synthase, partial [Candidatus Limnocylindrales bacterium]